MTVEYVLIIHPAEEGSYWAEVPALAGSLCRGKAWRTCSATSPRLLHLAADIGDGWCPH